MASYPTLIPTDRFNPSDFLSLDASLTLPVADLRYVKIGSAATLSSLNVGPLDCSALTIGGSPLDLSVITGVSQGVATPSKALVIDSGSNISGIGNIGVANITSSASITASGTISAYTNLTSPVGSIGALDVASLTLSGSAVGLSLISGVSAGTAAASKVLSMDSTASLVIPSTVGGSPKYELAWRDPLNTWSNEISMYRVRSGSGLWMKFYQKDNLYASPSCLLISLDGSLIPVGSTLPYTAATMLSLRHRPTASTSLDFTTNFYSQIGSTPQIDGLGNSFSINSDHDVLNLACNWGGNALRTTNNLAITSNGRMFFNTGTQITYSTWGGAGANLNANLGIITNNSFSDGSVNFDTGLFIKTSNSNPVSFAFQLHNGSAATSSNSVVMGTCSNNDFRIMTNNSSKMIITNTGLLNYVGSASTTLGAGSNVWRFDVQAGTVSSLGLGPTSYTLSAVFAQPIKARYVYSDSDRRLKRNISDLEMNEEHYKGFRPRVYMYRDEQRYSIGFVAQELSTVCGNMISYSDAPGMKIEDPKTDIENISMSVNYDQMTAVNCLMIKKLLARIESMEQQISELQQSSSAAGP